MDGMNGLGDLLDFWMSIPFRVLAIFIGKPAAIFVKGGTIEVIDELTKEKNK
jgi:hypothetical protein